MIDLIDYFIIFLGEGRPGWHIECSAMASDVFQQNLDIHTGRLNIYKNQSF